MKTITKENSKEMAALRWGDKLVCRLVTRKGIQVAQCQWNGEKFEGRGKDNLSALKSVFSKINGHN